MFTAALFTIAKIWKKSKCPLMEEQIKKMLYIHTQWNITQPLKKNKIMSLEAIWMDLKLVILNDTSHTEKDKYHLILLKREI